MKFKFFPKKFHENYFPRIFHDGGTKMVTMNMKMKAKIISCFPRVGSPLISLEDSFWPRFWWFFPFYMCCNCFRKYHLRKETYVFIYTAFFPYWFRWSRRNNKLEMKRGFSCLSLYSYVLCENFLSISNR